MKKILIFVAFLMSFNQITFLLAQEEKINDKNENGLPDQHENAVLKAAERICNMPGIQDILMKQIEDLKNDKIELQKQIENLKMQTENGLKEQQNMCEIKLKESKFEKDKIISDKEKVQLNLNDKSEQLIMCEARLEQKTWDRLISAGIGVVGASSCFLYQEIK